MKWTADAAVLQNVDFSSQFVKWIRDGTALCQTKVTTNHPLIRIMKQLQPIVAIWSLSHKNWAQLAVLREVFACTRISWEVVALLVLLFACWVVVVVVVVLLLGGCWGLLGAHSWPTARSGQCEVRFVWGGPARAGQSLSKRSWSWVLENTERRKTFGWQSSTVAPSPGLEGTDLKREKKMNFQQILKRIEFTCFPRPQDCPGYHPLWLSNDKFRNVAGN